MTSLNGVGNNAPKFMYQTEQQVSNQIGNQAGATDPISFSQTGSSASVETTDTSVTGLLSDTCTDGKDDGKVGFLKGAVSVVKGAVKSVGNMISQLNPLKHPFKFLAAAATAAVCILVPPVGVAVAVVGGVTAGVSLAGNAIKASQATSDAEKVALLENCGADGLQLGLSVAGAKAGMKAMKGTAGSSMEALAKEAAQTGKKAGILKTGEAFVKDTVSGGRGFKNGHINIENAGYKGTQIYTNVKGNIKENGLVDGLKQSLDDGVSNTKIKQAYDKTEAKKTVTDKDGNVQEIDRSMTERLQEARKDLKTQKQVEQKAAKTAKAEERLKEATENRRKLVEENASKSKIDAAQKELNKAAKQYDEVNAKVKSSIEKSVTDAQKALDDTKNSTKKANMELNKLKSEGADSKLIEAAQKKADLAKEAYTEAKTNLETAKAQQANTQKLYEEARAQKTELAKAKEQAKADLEKAKTEAAKQNEYQQQVDNAQKAYEEIYEKYIDDLSSQGVGSKSQYETDYYNAEQVLNDAKASLNNSKNAANAQAALEANYNQAVSDYTKATGNAAQSKMAKYDEYAKSAGYSSGFGSLTAPVAGGLAATNNDAQNLQQAQTLTQQAATTESQGWITPELQNYQLGNHDEQMALLYSQMNALDAA